MTARSEREWRYRMEVGFCWDDRQFLLTCGIEPWYVAV